MKRPKTEILVGDSLELMKAMPPKSVAMVCTPPPYVDARTYGIGFKRKGEEYVEWAFERFMECVRVSAGPVFWVIEGKTKDFRYDPFCGSGTTLKVAIACGRKAMGIDIRQSQVDLSRRRIANVQVGMFDA